MQSRRCVRYVCIAIIASHRRRRGGVAGVARSFTLQATTAACVAAFVANVATVFVLLDRAHRRIIFSVRVCSCYVRLQYPIAAALHGPSGRRLR